MGQHQRRSSLTERMRNRYRLEEAGPVGPGPGEEGGQSVHKLLQEKENDLVLAAELGKALLDKSEQISHAREAIVLDYTQKLEALSQDKYLLTRQLERLEEESQQEVAELQTEIEKLKRGVEKARRRRGAWEREVGEQVDTLTQDNQRLAAEVRRRADQERRLVTGRTEAVTELSARREHVAEHCTKIEELNTRIRELHSARASLETELESVARTVQSLGSSAQHSAAKEAALERRLQLQDSSLQELERDCEKMRSCNLQVFSRLERVSLSLLPHTAEAEASTTLLQEMESLASPASPTPIQDAEAVTEDSDSDSEGEEAGQLREEVVAVYEQIRNLVTNLRRSRPPPHPGTSLHTSIASSGSSTDNLATQFKVSQLNSLLHELDCLLLRRLATECGAEAAEGEVSCHQQRLQIEVELHQTKLAAEQTELRLKQVEGEARAREDQLQQLKCKLVLMTSSLAAAVEERDMYAEDILASAAASHAVIHSAQHKRDQAVEAKNAAEVELAKNRIELMQVNSQLLDTVQHKVRLSEQLEEMEVNIVDQIQDQVRDKLHHDTDSSSDSATSDSDAGKEKLSRKLSRMIFGK